MEFATNKGARQMLTSDKYNLKAKIKDLQGQTKEVVETGFSKVSLGFVQPH